MGGVRMHDSDGGDTLLGSLPPELVQDIFALCLPQDTLYITPSTAQAPLVLTTVSRAWRKLALATPLLWCSLSISNPGYAHANWLAVLDGTLSWFARAGGVPLRFSACGAFWAHPVLSVVWCELATRCSHFRACLHSDWISLWAYQNHEVDLKLLRSFQLSAPHGLYAPSLSRRLRTAVNLQHLAWANEFYPLRVTDVHWGQLTTVSVDCAWTPSSCLHVLRELRAVQRLVFSTSSLPSLDGHGDASETITLPHLELLSFCVADSCSALLSRLCLPALRQLGVTYWTGMRRQAPGGAQWFAHAFCALVRRSGCALRSLNLYMLPLAEGDLLECVRATHASLRELTLKMKTDAVTDEVLDLLTHHPGVECLCPQLEVLALYGRLACSVGKLAEVAASRLRDDPGHGVGRLKMIETTVENPQIPALLPLRREGLLLRVYGDYGNKVMPPDNEETREENEAKFQQLLKEGLTWFAYPADASTSHLEFDPAM